MKFLVFAVFLASLAVVSAFSEYACIVTGKMEEPSCAPELRIWSGVLMDVRSQNQVFYKDFEVAITTCPFDPVLIEVVGTVYVPNNIKHTKAKNLWIRGVTQYDEEIDRYIAPTLVGFKDVLIATKNITVVLDNLVLEGCDTDRPLFARMCSDCAVGLHDQSFMATDLTVLNYSGEDVLVQHATDKSISFAIENSQFSNIAGSAICVDGSHSVRIFNNVFESCGDEEHSCVIINRADVGDFEMSQNKYK